METTMVTLAGALADARGLFVSMLLIALLALKELALSTAGPRARVSARALQLAIVPLLLLFGLAITLRLTQDPPAQPAQPSAPQVRALATPIQPAAPPAAAAVPTVPAAPTAAPLAYSVRQGDLLFDLAQRFNTSADAIVALNPQINPDSLVIGAVLHIPAAPAAQEAPTAPLQPGQIAYTIRAGDTLYDLAPRFKTTVAAIVALNPQIKPERLMVGQELRIPIAQLQPTQERKP